MSSESTPPADKTAEQARRIEEERRRMMEAMQQDVVVFKSIVKGEKSTPEREKK